MGWIDLILGIAVVAATIRGLRLGAVMQVTSFVGFWAGLALGVVVSLLVVRHVATGSVRVWATLGITLGCAILVGVVGRVLGGWASVALRRWHLGAIDSGLGAAIGAVSILISVWLIAGFVVQSQVAWLGSALGSSAVLRAVDKVLPPVPAALSQVQGFLSSQGFPPVFAGVVPPNTPSIATPSSAEADAIGHKVAASVLKVFGPACGGYLEGSGFIVAPGVVVTNAHVIAGMRAPTVIVGGTPVAMTPVLVDPDLDLAVLRTTASIGPSLVLDTAIAPRGTPAAVVGFPGNGSLVNSEAAVSATFDAVGRDIYGSSLVTRQVYEITSVVRPGNSGGPLVASDGRVLGVVFSRSTINDHVGYALTAGAVARDVARGESFNAPVGTGACASG
ncbi:MAG: MarP family serine protease [Actinomycetes bacterium]